MQGGGPGAHAGTQPWRRTWCPRWHPTKEEDLVPALAPNQGEGKGRPPICALAKMQGGGPGARGESRGQMRLVNGLPISIDEQSLMLTTERLQVIRIFMNRGYVSEHFN
ncbi:MAG: hypothetical protein IKS20_04620 [Victivallales bacterium]|nr:hypothetical protein [Victivallales bacterium]